MKSTDKQLSMMKMATAFLFVLKLFNNNSEFPTVGYLKKRKMSHDSCHIFYIPLHSAGVQPHSAGVQPHSAGVQPHSAGVQPHSAGVQPHSAGVQPHSAGVQPLADAPVLNHLGEDQEQARINNFLASCHQSRMLEHQYEARSIRRQLRLLREKVNYHRYMERYHQLMEEFHLKEVMRCYQQAQQRRPSS